MAKKVRTPAPPRPVQAPKRRVEPRQRPGVPFENYRYWLVGGLAVLIVIGVIAGVLASRGGGASTAAVAKAAKAAGGTFQTVTATKSALHIANFKPTVTYNSYPPTSGKHYYRPAFWDNYSQPVDPRQAVHNEEHGGVVVWYGPQISSQTREEITRFYDESPDGMLVTPLPDETPGVKFPPHKPLGSRIAMTAWVGDAQGGHGYVMILPKFDEKAMKAFRDAFRGKAPERFPLSSLKPRT